MSRLEGTTEDTTTPIGFLISRPNVYVGFAAPQGSVGADVDGLATSRWGR